MGSGPVLPCDFSPPPQTFPARVESGPISWAQMLGHRKGQSPWGRLLFWQEAMSTWVGLPMGRRTDSWPSPSLCAGAPLIGMQVVGSKGHILTVWEPFNKSIMDDRLTESLIFNFGFQTRMCPHNSQLKRVTSSGFTQSRTVVLSEANWSSQSPFIGQRWADDPQLWCQAWALPFPKLISEITFFQSFISHKSEWTQRSKPSCLISSWEPLPSHHLSIWLGGGAGDTGE